MDGRRRRGQGGPPFSDRSWRARSVSATHRVCIYWPCSGKESPVWAGLRHVLEIFEGDVYEPYGHVEGCPAEIPQSLQAASLFALVTVGLTVALAFSYIFQRSIQRLRASIAPRVIVFSGLDDETIEAARTIRRNLTSRQRMFLLDAGPEINRAQALAREVRGPRTNRCCGCGGQNTGAPATAGKTLPSPPNREGAAVPAFSDWTGCHSRSRGSARPAEGTDLASAKPVGVGACLFMKTP